MAGVKGRSGRKPDTAILNCRELIDSAVTAADWRAMWRKVISAAKKGDLQAARFLTEYRYGPPQPQMDPPPSPATSFVAYYLPYHDGQSLPTGTRPVEQGPDGELKLTGSETIRDETAKGE